MSCNQCGGRFGVEPSCFPGWNLLACMNCHRPIRLVKDERSRSARRREALKLARLERRQP